MTLVPLNIAKPYYSIDPVSKSILSDAITDGWIDESNTLRRRGGLKTWLDLADNGGEAGKPGYGIWYYAAWDWLIVRHGSKAFGIDSTGAVHAFSGVTFAQLPSSFAEGSEIDGDPCFYLFDGGYPVLGKNLVKAGPTWVLSRLNAGTGAPQYVNWGAWLDGRFLIAEKDSRKFYATDTNPGTGNIEPDYFLAADNPLTAETKPDNISFLGSNTQELQVWGKQGMEVWVSDTSFFSPVKGAFTEAGLLAPYTVKEAGGTLFALCLVDGMSKRAVVKLSGRTPVVVSNPIEKVLSSYAVVEDAVAFITANSEYILTFPTEKKTWCYDYRNDTWYQWTLWDDGSADRGEFVGRYSATAWGKTFFLSRLDGKIYQYDPATFKDGGSSLVTEWRSGHVGRGVGSRCAKLRIQLKRGVGDSAGGSCTLEVKWRDNGKKEWGVPRLIDLGKEGEYEFIKEISGLGSYKTRQYSFSLAGNTDLAIANVWEDVTALTR